MRSLLLLTALLYAVVHANAECTRNPPTSSLDYEYVKDLTGVNSVVFKIKACRDALIALASSTETQAGNTRVPDDAYELVIGGSGNTKTVIRDNPGGTTVAEYDRDNILDCINLKSFWIKWDNNDVMVGMGSTVGKGEMTRYAKIRDINHMFITGLVQSTWKFDSCDNL